MRPWRNEKYLAWVRRQDCSVCLGAGSAFNPIEAHHVRTSWNCGASQKPADYIAIPVHKFDCHGKCGSNKIAVAEQLVDVTRMIDMAIYEGIIEIKVK